MFEVRDRSKLIRFEGELLAQASSRKGDRPRWIEFELYRTLEGSYVLSRVGMSLLFHAPDCIVIQRNNLEVGDVSDDCVPCDLCGPDYDEPEPYVEKPRYWAQVSQTPGAVIDALYQFDSAGARYLTRVASSLVEQAAKRDPDVADAYNVEYIQ